MSKNIKKSFAPRYRFPEFRDNGDWDYPNGNKLFEPIVNKDHNSDLPILAISQDYGAIPRDMIDYHISVTEKSIESYKVVEIGDFIISLRSFQGGIEYSAYKGICSPAYIILRKKFDKIENHFYRFYFKSVSFIKDLNKNIEGIRDGKMVSYTQFSELNLPFPDYSEQQKIADCLTSLDELITAEVDKLEAYKAHKKGLLQKLFPAEGKTVPEWRFPEFRGKGEWKEKRLDDVCINISSGKDKNEIDGEYYLYGSTGIIGKTNSASFNGQYILVARVGANAGFINHVNGIFGVTDNTLVVALSDPKIIGFINYALEGYGLNKLIFGSGQPLITGGQLKALQINFPDIVEQLKIADCFTSIDELITAQAQKIEALKTHKKGLMQGLFPPTDEVGE